MVVKPSRSLFNRIFSSKNQSDDLISSEPLDSAVDLNSVDELVVDREFSPDIQPPRLRRLQEVRAAQIQAYQDSLAVAPSDSIAEPKPFDGSPEANVADDFSGDFSGAHESELETGPILPVSRLRGDRRKTRKLARAKARRKTSLKARLSGVGVGAVRGAGRGVLWTGALLKRQSKAVFNRLYPFI